MKKIKEYICYFKSRLIGSTVIYFLGILLGYMIYKDKVLEMSVMGLNFS